MKTHRVRIRRYLLTSSWEAQCYDCNFSVVRIWWEAALYGGLLHYESEEEIRLAATNWNNTHG